MQPGLISASSALIDRLWGDCTPAQHFVEFFASSQSHKGYSDRGAQAIVSGIHTPAKPQQGFQRLLLPLQTSVGQQAETVT